MSGSIVAAILAGVALITVAFAHAIGPALMLAAETPFDAIPFALFGVVGNGITYIPILIFLIKVNPGYWGRALVGTRIQQYAALLILVLLVSHAIPVADRGLDVIFEWLRKATLFLLLAIFAWSMRNAKHLALLAKVMVTAMGIFVVLSALDFYLGIQLLPIKAGRLQEAALETEFKQYLATAWRFTGPGYPVNRFSNYLLLATFLGIGWFVSVRSPLQRGVALACTATLMIGELLTVTRSGILGMGVGLLLLLPLAFRFRPAQVFGLAAVGGVLGVCGYYVLGITSGEQVLATRFDLPNIVHGGLGRITRVLAALEIWSNHPFVGVGWGNFKRYSIEYIPGGGLGAHNGYTNVLAECGLLGFIPLMLLTVAVVRRSLIRVGHISPEHEFWRPYFLCGLVAQLVTNVFNDYLWERYLWLTFAFVSTLEYLQHAARAQALQKHREAQMRSFGSQPFLRPEARSSGGA